MCEPRHTASTHIQHWMVVAIILCLTTNVVAEIVYQMNAFPVAFGGYR